MTIHLGNDDRSHIYSLPKGLGLSIALLSNRAVHHKDAVIRTNSLLDLLHFVEKLGLLFVSTRSINNNDLHSFLLELSHSLLSNCHRVSLNVTTVERNPDFSSVLLQLIEGTSSEGIRTDHPHSPSFLLVVVGHFTASCGLSTSLQPDKHDDVDFSPLGFKWFFVNLKQRCQFLDDCLFDHDPQVSSSLFFVLKLVEDILSQLHHVSNIDVTSEEGVTDLLEALLDCLFVDDRRFVEFLKSSGDLSA